MASWTTRAAVAASLALAATLAATARAADPSPDVQAQLDAMKARIAELEAKQSENWLTEERAAEIKGIVNDVLADARNHGQFLDSDLTAGYDNGFFVGTTDKNFLLKVNGYLQYRYTFAHDELHNASAFGSSKPASGDASELGFRRARLIFSGNAFDPNLIYMISGDFGNQGNNSGNFQILDTFIGYNFNPALKVKGGAMLVPFTYAEAYSSGISLPEFSTTSIAFDAVRTLGVSLYGDLIKDQLTYEVQINDGSKANALGRPGDSTSGKGMLDNRMGYYARMEWAGNGSIGEMHSESDDKESKDLIWLLGGAVGYEEQNSQSSAFPASQSSLALIGLLTNTSPGFVGSQTVNGGIYRATTDFHAKYMGFSFGAAGYMQYLNDELPAGSSTDSFRKLFHEDSIAEYGYTVQAGYFLVPHKFEIVGRIGQLLTCGLPNTMEEYTLGANYYLFGQNAKLQFAETYIPNEAAFTDSAPTRR